MNKNNCKFSFAFYIVEYMESCLLSTFIKKTTDSRSSLIEVFCFPFRKQFGPKKNYKVSKCALDLSLDLALAAA